MGKNSKNRIDLQFFAEGGGDGGGAGQGVGAASPAAQTDAMAAKAGSAANQGAQPPQQERQPWEEVKKAYHDEFSNDVSGIIRDRLRDRNELLEYKTKTSPALEAVARKYGVDPSDVDGLIKAIDDDDSLYEDEALERGMTVDQVKEFRALEMENQRLKEAQERQQQQERMSQFEQAWSAGEAEVRQLYDPNFDYKEESRTNPNFRKLIVTNVPLKLAYEVCHKNDLDARAMSTAATKTEQAVINKIRAQGMRPTEAGLSGTQAVNLNVDPRKLTPEQRAEIKKRVRAGEKITF